MNVDWRRAGLVLAVGMAVFGALGAWLAAGSHFGWFPTVVLTVALLGGVAILPAFFYLVGRESLPVGMRSAVVRILWTIAALIHGPYVAWYHDDGRVELVRGDPDRDAVYVDGEWRTLADDVTWSRLGKQPFGVSYGKTESQFADIRVRAQDHPTDGGPVVYGDGAGRPIGSRLVGLSDIVINYETVSQRLRGAAGAGLADAAKRDGLIDYGGDLNLSVKWLVLGIISCLVLGSVTGYLVFGASL